MNPSSPFSAMFDQTQFLTNLWVEFATKMMATAVSTDPSASAPDNARRMRSAMFQAMGQATEQYMRSPQFLQTMQGAINASIEARKQMNDLLTRMHHDAQGTAKQDVDTLQVSVRHMETRVLDRLDEIASRLDALSQRLDALEGGNGATDNGESGPSASARSAAGQAKKRTRNGANSRHGD